MRTIVYVSMISVLMISFAATGADDSDDQTLFKTEVFQTKLINGRPWKRLDEQSRITYLTGLEDGGALLIDEMADSERGKDTAREAFTALGRLTVKGFRFSDIMKEIDAFYEQSSNARVPVVDAYRHVLKKFKGASPETLATNEAALRKRYNQ